MGFSFTYFALVRFASGQIVPLWMYPDVLQPILNFLPFKSVFYTPLAIFNGVLQGSALTSALLTQTAWMVGLFVVARLVWGRIHHSLIVQGG
jgi:ABC-2 type transport system permease protein